MTKRGHGVILHHDDEISGYLILGDEQYEIKGHRVSAIRTNLELREIRDETTQKDMFDEQPSEPGESECDLV